MDEISLRDVWRSVLGHRSLILATTAAGIVVALALAFLTTPVYRAEVLLAPVDEEERSGLSAIASQFGGLAALAGIDLRGTGSRKNEAVALLKSRSLVTQFIEDKQLLPVLFADEWNAAGSQWKSADADDAPSMWDGYRLFDDDIRTVTENPKTGLVILAIEWQDPALAKTWADQLVQRVNAETRARAIREAEHSLSYLDQQLKKTDVIELRQAIYSLVENQTKQMMLANVRDDYAFRVIDPAALPDPDDPVRPRPLLLLALGSLSGLIFGLLFALLLGARSGFESTVPPTGGRSQA